MTVAKNVLNRIHVQRLLLAVALLGVSLTAGAASSFPGFMAKVTGRSTTVGAASDGTLIVTKGAGLTAGGGWTNAGNYGVAPGVGGSVRIGGTGTVMAGGKAVPVEITGSLTKEAIVGGLMGCLSGSIVGCVIGAGTPLAAAFLLSGDVRVNPQNGQMEMPPQGACSFNCKSYRFVSDFPGRTWRRTKYQALEDFAAYATADDPTYKVVIGACANTGPCEYTLKEKNGTGTLGPFGANFQEQVREPDSGTWAPATPKQVTDALIAAGAPEPMMVPELEKSGVDWAKRWPGYDTNTEDGTMAKPKVIGPASIKGERVVTTNPDGSTTTKETETPIMYQGSKVTAGDTTTTEKKTKVDGTPGEETKTVTEPGDEPAKPEEPAKDPCEGHPARLGCIDIDVPEGEIPKTTKNVTFEAEDPLGSGACPANVTASFSTLGGQSATIVDWQTFCGQALPLRALVMGLAAIMAFFIIMPGGVRE